MGDKELLELAAKAALLEYHHENGIIRTAARSGGYTPWNPLKDDGDALRLAVKLGLKIEHHDNDSVVVWHDYIGTGVIPYAGDAYASTRGAIVFAAAEIGKAMP